MFFNFLKIKVSPYDIEFLQRYSLYLTYVEDSLTRSRSILFQICLCLPQIKKASQLKELIFLDKSDEDSRIICHFSSNLLTLIGLVCTFVTVYLLKAAFILAMFLSCSPQYKLRSHLGELFAFFSGLCILENKGILALTQT